MSKGRKRKGEEGRGIGFELCISSSWLWRNFSSFSFPARMFQILGRVISHDLNAGSFPYRLSLFRGTRVVNEICSSGSAAGLK